MPQPRAKKLKLVMDWHLALERFKLSGACPKGTRKVATSSSWIHLHAITAWGNSWIR